MFTESGMLDAFGDARSDPAVIAEIAHETAAILVRTGRASDDPALTARLVGLVEDLGIDTLADLWADRPARSLPGVLWRLYVLREWVRRDPVGASNDFAEGVRHADVAVVIAGVGTPPGPQEVRELADALLRGVYDGDLAMALERASAFCRVVASGRASREPDVRGDLAGGRVFAASDAVGDSRGPGSASSRSAATVDDVAARHARSAAAVLTMADDLAASAGLWRRGDLP